MKFGDNLRRLRKSKKISQESLAEEMNVTRQSVSKWETGESYPEMNNILELCKIFHCHINDLVHEDMSDIDSLDEEIKMKVVKFKGEKQKKIKVISNIIYIFSKIGKVMMIASCVILAILMLIAPFTIKNVNIVDSSIMYQDKLIGSIDDVKDLDMITNFLSNTSQVQLVIYSEIIMLCIIISLVFVYIILRELEKLFKNIHDGETPFTINNVNHIKKIAKYLIFYVLFPIISGYIMQLIMGLKFGVEIELLDLIFILIIYSIAYIFEYGYEIQIDSKGVMYNEKK